MKGYEEILSDNWLNKFYAHKKSENQKENLVSHAEESLKYLNVIIKNLHLEPIITTLLKSLFPEKAIDIIYRFVLNIIYYHDFGKINPKFQKEKMDNILPISKKVFLNSTHSLYGKIFFDLCFMPQLNKELGEQEISQKLKNITLKLASVLTYTIERHHSPLIDIKSKVFESSEIFPELKKLVDLFFIQKEVKHMDSLKAIDKGVQNAILKLEPNKQKAMFYLFKLVFSLLITSDYYATMQYMKGISYKDDINVLNQSLVEKLELAFYDIPSKCKTKHHFNFYLKNKSNITRIETMKIKEVSTFNDLKTKILLEADKNLKIQLKDKNNKIFYLRVPTGGGKTNTSLKLALTLLKYRPSLNRIYYVFPFINIIEQNYRVIKSTLNYPDLISPIYSTSQWIEESSTEEAEIKYALNNEFLNQSIVVMSNVTFFNSFLKASKHSNYRFHNLANSIVIIDEIQSLNDYHWGLFADILSFSSQFLNIHYIIMSATLPNITKIIDNSKFKVRSLDLLTQPHKYFDHNLFKNRVEIIYKPELNSLELVIKFLERKLETTNYHRVLLVVNTISQCYELFSILENNSMLQHYKILLLNSTILPHRRQIVIDQMKSKNKIILVSTQSIEAGVDIDCDFGIRDFALFDSIEQVAGRINRNSLAKAPAELVICKLETNGRPTADAIYSNTIRWDIMRKHYPTDKQKKKFLLNRNFQFGKDNFYEKVLKIPKKVENSGIYLTPTQDLNKLKFTRLNRINVIDQQSIQVLVNIKISRTQFSKLERKFLSKNDINSEFVEASTLRDAYHKFQSSKSTFTGKKISTKKWASILAKYMISLSNRKINNKLLSEQINQWEKFPLLLKYDIRKGINPNNLNQNDFS